MKKNILALFFLLILPALSLAQPAILFDEVIHDFGTVSQEDAVKYVFEFTNTGDQELIIEKVAATWGCAAAMASSGHLKPLEKGKINVTVNVKGTSGSLSKTVQVHTNDPNKPLTILTLKMVVKGPGPMWSIKELSPT